MPVRRTRHTHPRDPYPRAPLPGGAGWPATAHLGCRLSAGKLKVSEERNRRLLLFGAYAVLFVLCARPPGPSAARRFHPLPTSLSRAARYCIATFLSAFFTQVATAISINGIFNGVIFAAYPMGMAITSLFASQAQLGTPPSAFSHPLVTNPVRLYAAFPAAQAIRFLGGRFAVVVGLSCTAFLTLLFGSRATLARSPPSPPPPSPPPPYPLPLPLLPPPLLAREQPPAHSLSLTNARAASPAHGRTPRRTQASRPT